MDFSEMLTKVVKNGAKARRPQWAPKLTLSYAPHRKLFLLGDDECVVSSAWLLAQDWELVPEPKAEFSIQRGANGDASIYASQLALEYLRDVLVWADHNYQSVGAPPTIAGKIKFLLLALSK